MPKTETKEAPKKEVKKESEAAVEFRAVMAAYKERNPVKYEIKREELEAKLAKL